MWFRLLEEGSVVWNTEVHAHDTFAILENEKCDQFERDLFHMLPAKNVGATLVFEVLLQEGLGEGHVDDFSANVC